MEVFYILLINSLVPALFLLFYRLIRNHSDPGSYHRTSVCRHTEQESVSPSFTSIDRPLRTEPGPVFSLKVLVTPTEEEWVKRVVQYIEINMESTELSVQELSRAMGMNRVNLYRKLRVITGRSPSKFIRSIRMQQAARLLSCKQLNVSEVAYQVGFNNPKYFSKCFKKEFGSLPSVYQSSTLPLQTTTR
ncbi:MAG: helix-turn-helix transcriptional regulator [Bacteroides sp.]|nr:helix-turn-helix transcriptional regulator [Bacteroides sp.]